MQIRPIKTKADHRAALREIDRLMDAKPGTLDLIRFRGHLPKGGYDVRNGRHTQPASAPAVHG